MTSVPRSGGAPLAAGGGDGVLRFWRLADRSLALELPRRAQIRDLLSPRPGQLVVATAEGLSLVELDRSRLT